MNTKLIKWGYWFIVKAVLESVKVANLLDIAYTHSKKTAKNNTCDAKNIKSTLHIFKNRLSL